MITKKLEDIESADLESLVQNNVQERKNLEYKAELPGGSEGAKKEFLADVSSFANTDGGDLIFGIREVDGVLQSDLGLSISNIDSEIARIENMLRDGISPRFSVQIRAIEVGDGKVVLMIRIKASLEGPHRVVFGSHDKFYKRNSNGKNAMDVGELRTAFIQGSELVERIKRFRTARIGDIKSGDTPFPLASTSSFLTIHIVPLSAFTSSFRLDSQTLLALQRAAFASLFQPIAAASWNHRINLDGVTAYVSPEENSPVRTYTQIYRDGKVESVLSDVYNGERLPMGSIEARTMDHAKKMMQLLSQLEFQPPFYIFLSLVGIEGFRVGLPQNVMFDQTAPITQKEILLPEVVIENPDADIQQLFRPIFDMIWNASGVSRSLNFDENGQHTVRI